MAPLRFTWESAWPPRSQAAAMLLAIRLLYPTAVF